MDHYNGVRRPVPPVGLPADDPLHWLHETNLATVALETLGRRLGLTFPSEELSPSHSKPAPEYVIRKLFGRLFYMDQGRRELERGLRDCFEWLPALTDRQEKLVCLQKRLEKAFAVTPKRQNKTLQPFTSPNSIRSFAEVVNSETTAPASPTMSIKHGPKMTGSASNLFNLPPPVILKEGTISKNTSFTTLTSFWSNPNESRASLSTAASFDSAMDHDAPVEKGTQASDIQSSTRSKALMRELLQAQAQAPVQGFDPEVAPVPSEVRPQSSGSGKKRPWDGGEHIHVHPSKRPPSPVARAAGDVHDHTHLSGTQTSELLLSSATAAIYEKIGLEDTDAFGKVRLPTLEPDSRGRHDSIAGGADIPQPPRTPVHVAKSPAANTPARHYRVTQIPAVGLSRYHLPPSFMQLRLDLRLEVFRVLQTKDISVETLDSEWRAPRSMATLHKLVADKRIPFQRGFETDFSDASLRGRLRWSTTGPLVDFELLPPRKEKSNELQRKYGGHRLLFLDSAPPSRPPPGLDKVDVKEAFIDMIMQEHQLLGCKWRQFCVREKKRGKNGKRDSVQTGSFEFALFAVEGPGIDSIRIADFLDKYLHFRPNNNELSGKLNSRIELGLSRTEEGVSFSDDQLEWISDLPTTEHPDDTTFNDPDLQHMFPTRRDENGVMSDGTATISAYALDRIRKAIGHKEDRPISVLQGRIKGAKGTWAVGKPEALFQHSPAPPAKQISISESQIKIKQPIEPDDRNAIFNLVGTNRPAKPSVLFTGYLQILEDRHVPAEAIKQYVRDQLQLFMNSFETAAQDPMALRSWLYTQNDILRTAHRDMGIETVAGLPMSQVERIILMLESGFEPSKNSFLADELRSLMKRIFSLKMKSFKIPCPRSTMLIGIVDRSGIVQPGEVHINFSKEFHDLASGQSHTSWNNMPALVTRNPARRRSDIRKLKIRCYPELAWLTDCVVFSSLGLQAECSKMQGGDLDGDIFWICVERCLVRPFTNAPAPRESDLPLPESLSITKDLTKVCDVITIPEAREEPLNENQVLEWIRANTVNRTRFNLLGTVTNKLEALTYKDNNIATEQATQLNNLLDYIIDAPKRCYKFDHSDWAKFQNKFGIPHNLPAPAHRKFTSLDEGSDNLGDTEWKRDNIVDQVYFDVLQNGAIEALQRVEVLLKDATVHDSHMTDYYHNRRQDVAANSIMRAELDDLPKRFDDVKKEWEIGQAIYQGSVNKKSSDYVACVEQCRALYDAIKPKRTCEGIEQWLKPSGNNSLTQWDLLKASAFAKDLCSWAKWSRLLFNVAGSELCLLKAQAMGTTRTLTMTAYLGLTPRRNVFVKDSNANDVDESGDENDEDVVDDFDDGLGDEKIFDELLRGTDL